MAQTAVIETETGALLVLDPPTRADGSVILPEGADPQAVQAVALSAEDAITLQQPRSRFFYRNNRVEAEQVIDVSGDEAAALRQQIVNLMQAAVGVVLTDLTAGQRSALTAGLLWKAGAIDNELKIRPLNEWLRE